ncbi:glycoside hydrolase family 127 protein [Herbiconiux sp. P17]|uniref:glycoside hydrolase family 127 protein n=1 Tax=Herbiconiux wuyangfengii TaxID=3342794 RepID=UPI0035B6F69E
MTTTSPSWPAAAADEPTSFRAPGPGPVHPGSAALHPLGFTQTTLVDGMLAELQRRNGRTSIPHGHDHLSEQGAWQNFENAAARRTGTEHHGPNFEDGEVFKWLEAVAWEAGRTGRTGRAGDDGEHDGDTAELTAWLDRYSALAARAQADDGYLATFNQTGQRERYEWISFDHEIFNMATMIQAAVAQYRATGRTALLDVARKAADHLDATFGWGKREELCGHPLIEMALVELYRATDERRYLDLASYFVEKRGHGTITDPTWQDWSSTYFSDRIPVRETEYPEGHAVRAVYFAAGATDVAVETGDTELLESLRRQWDNMVDAKTYVNGSLGSRWEGEAFGDPYELPTDRGYGETCAAIASTQWSWRLLLATGDIRYADLIERQLYNAVLSGVSLDGDEYFYVNSLQVREGAVAHDSRMPASGRHAWFGTSCCPTNLMRTIATVHQYLATTSEAGVQVHQFASADIRTPQALLRMRTGYPWDGDVVVEIGDDASADRWELAIRVPAWAEGATLEVEAAATSTAAAVAEAVGDASSVTDDGTGIRAVAPGYARVERVWAAGDRITLRLPMEPRIVTGHHRVDAVRGAVAIERGPLVYAIEQIDQAEGALVDDLELTGDGFRVERHPTLGVPAVHFDGRRGPDGAGDPGDPIDVIAIPYSHWANREVGPMKVWIPDARPTTTTTPTTQENPS